MLESVSARFRTNSEQLFETKIGFFKQKPNRALCKSLIAIYSRPQFGVISGK